jgi:FkbM family methyltransferase
MNDNTAILNQINDTYQTQNVSPCKHPYYIVPSKYGPMIVNYYDQYMTTSFVKYGEYSDAEIELLQQVLSFFDGNIIEVGANIGSHSVPLAQYAAGRNNFLYVFEPQPVIFQQLCTNLCLNALFNVKAMPYACSDQKGSVYFNAIDYTKSNNFGGIEMHEHEHEINTSELSQINQTNSSIMQEVTCIQLDDLPELHAQKIALLKIDVEGFELNAIKGATQIIQKHRPALYLENDRVHNSKALIEYIWQQGYDLWWHIPQLFNPNNFYQNTDNIFGNVASFNMIALPKERTDIPNYLLKIEDADAHPLKK